MLSKKYRFHSRGGVKYTHRKGKTIKTPHLSLVFTDNTHNKQRFAIVVSKKVLKSAIGRNRIRRRIYEAIRLILPDIKKPTDCLFIVNSREVKDLLFSELQQQVTSLLQKAKIVVQ